MQEIAKSPSTAISVYPVLLALKRVAPYFSDGYQHDAHEVYVSITVIGDK